MKSIEYINNATIIFIALFNAGMTLRIVQICISGMQEESENTRKNIMNYIKAMVIIDSVLSIISILQRYYK